MALPPPAMLFWNKMTGKAAGDCPRYWGREYCRTKTALINNTHAPYCHPMRFTTVFRCVHYSHLVSLSLKSFACSFLNAFACDLFIPCNCRTFVPPVVSTVTRSHRNPFFILTEDICRAFILSSSDNQNKMTPLRSKVVIPFPSTVIDFGKNNLAHQWKVQIAQNLLC